MHPLAIEDLIHSHGRGRSKADYYPKHLFLRMMCHRIAPEDDLSLDASLGHIPVDPSTITRSESPEPMEMDHNEEKDIDTTHDGTVVGSPDLRKSSGSAAARDIEATAAEKHRPRPPLRHSSWSSTILNIARKVCLWLSLTRRHDVI